MKSRLQYLLRALSVLAAVLVLGGLPACGEPPSALVVWHAYRGGEEAALKLVLARFERERGVKVTALAVPYDAYLSKLEAAIPRGNGPDVFIGPHTNLRACVVGKNTDIMRAARVDEGVVIGDECVVEEEAIVSTGIKIYPFKTVEAGAVVNANVIFESRGQRNLFGPRGVSGIVNVEITPELAVRLASAWATTCPPT